MNREHVIITARALVAESGLINLSRLELCERAGIPDGSFPHVMGCTFAELVAMLRTEQDVEKPKTTHVVNRSRANPELRKEQILAVAVKAACVVGYDKITRDEIARDAGVSTGLVTRYFGTMLKLKRAVMRSAIHTSTLKVVAQGLANNDPHARKASPELKQAALAMLANL